GISLADARWMAIPIDSRRKTNHANNVQALKDYVKRIETLKKGVKTPAPKAKAKPKAEKKPAPSPAKPIETDLADLTGITKKMAETIAAAGIPSIRVLSTIAPRRLARLTDLKRDRAEKIIESAKRYQREKTKVLREQKTKEPKITELKHLPDMSRAEIKQLKELGVESLTDLKAENARDLALITGLPETRIKDWQKVIRATEKEA
ncbi:MAG: helix-hairpin-helix domain-containing protein, partial [Candidatus Hermodarchaeota archaeon]|nr:helix-hairpin-helix domain-containing protein [Candidatus Hermodarchaeota archaeon]